MYPLNVISLLNAVLGIAYVHTHLFDNSLAPDASTPIKTEHGDTTYYFFPSEDLPLFAPLRALGVPERVIDVVEPFFREVVELGYDRSIEPWKPTPARLIPNVDPAKVAGDLVDAIGEGIDNARALVEPQKLLKVPAASTNKDTDEDVQKAELQTNESVGAVESVVDGRTTAKSPGSTNDSTPVNAGHARQTPLRDAVKKLSSDVKKVVADVSNSIKKAMSAGKHDTNKGASEDEGSEPQGSTSFG